MQLAVSETAPRNNLLFLIVAVLSLAGLVDSAISLQRHYAKSETNFCDLTQKFSCDVVNRSEYSTVLDVPVAGIGVGGYAALLLLATLWKSQAETPSRLLAASVAGVAFALYLTYIEAYKLMTWCILCLASLCLIFLIAVLAAVIKLRKTEG